MRHQIWNSHSHANHLPFILFLWLTLSSSFIYCSRSVSKYGNNSSPFRWCVNWFLKRWMQLVCWKNSMFYARVTVIIVTTNAMAIWYRKKIYKPQTCFNITLDFLYHYINKTTLNNNWINRPTVSLHEMPTIQ